MNDDDPQREPPGEDCPWCPVCRAARLARQTSPEVKAHLAQAVSSLVQAAAELLATPARGPEGQQVQEVDGEREPDWDEDRRA